MTLQVADTTAAPPPAADTAGIDAAELARLMSSFNEVTARLHETHDRLHKEVHRLRSQLADANEQLQRSQRLAALGQMAAGIAHEVRNPLGSIRLYARMLQEDLAGRPEQQSVAARIAEAVVGLDAVVGDVLSFAREIVVRPSLVDAHDLLERAADAAMPPAGAIRVEYPLADDEEAVPLLADAALLQQALVNLVRNAVEAMDEAGATDPGEDRVLTLTAERAPDPEREDGREEVVLGVADTGPGMGQDVIDRMFNPFFTTRHTGTGLGLAIVHRIVDAHAGRIVVHSRTAADDPVDSAPRGTTIRLHLPQPAGGSDEPARTAGDDVQEARQ